MVTFIFIRHGESTDNLKAVWAGWKDASLSNHGMNASLNRLLAYYLSLSLKGLFQQAKAVGRYFSSTRFTAIHTSDLKRTSLTAQAIQDAQKSSNPQILSWPLLREQHFGIAEGKPYSHARTDTASLSASGEYPRVIDRDGSFPDGESKNKMRRRAERVIDEILLPYVWKDAREGQTDTCVAIVSHGLFIKELLVALLSRNEGDPSIRQMPHGGLRNTAWAKATVNVQGAKGGKILGFADTDLPSLKVRLTDFDRHEHLDAVVRQKGGIGSQAHDPKQKDIRAFFGGRG